MKNRQAAEKSRKRKKEQTERLESDATRLRIDNEKILVELARLKQLARKLRAVQSEHEKICEFSQVNQYNRHHQQEKCLIDLFFRTLFSYSQMLIIRTFFCTHSLNKSPDY